jgi:hypothetical protein
MQKSKGLREKKAARMLISSYVWLQYAVVIGVLVFTSYLMFVVGYR